MEPFERKLSNFKALSLELTTYRVVNPRDGQTREDATAEFLRKGSAVNFPVTVKIPSKNGDPNEDKWLPYRIFPAPAMKVLSASVKFLEYCLQRDNTPGHIEPEDNGNPYADPQIREGALQLATILIPSCLLNPDKEAPAGRQELTTEDAAGGTLLHRANPQDPNKPIATKRAKMLQGLINRLEKYETVRIATEKTEEERKETSPALEEIQRLQHLFQQEMKSSLQAWKLLRDQLSSKTQSLEDLAFGEQQEALRDTDDYDPLDQEEDDREFGMQAQYLEGDENALSGGGDSSQKRRLKGNLPCEPQGWLWNETADPLEVIAEFVAEEITRRVEEKRTGILYSFQDKTSSPQEKQREIPILPEKKYNPNDWWKLMGTLSEEFPGEEDERSEHLAAARFAVCLRETNIAHKIDHGTFLQQWEKTTREHLDGTKPQPSRNHALLATLKATDDRFTKNAQASDQWLEYLQTIAPGGYENSSSQEKNRKEILQTLNKMVSGLTESFKNPDNLQPEAAQSMEKTVDRIAEGITKSLSGPTGQTVRRELRYHVKALKDQAEARKETAEAQNFKELWKWLTSISSKILDGTWYEPETAAASKSVVRGMLIDILSKEIGKSEGDIFKGSPEPAPKSTLQTNIEFLKGISGDNMTKGIAGRHVIQGLIDASNKQINQLRTEGLGTELSTKIWSREKNIENLPNKIRATEMATNLLENIPQEKEPLQALFTLSEKNLERLISGPENEEAAVECLAFWDAMQSLSENIRMRKEAPQYQPSSLGRNILRTCAQMAKEHYTGQQKIPTHIRESMARNSRRVVLLSNAIAPLALWIDNAAKGKTKKATQKDLVQSYQEKTHKLKAINALFQSKDSGSLEKHIKLEETICFALNLNAMDKLKAFLIEPKELALGIAWQRRNSEKVLIANENFPQLDSPQQKMQHFTKEKAPKAKGTPAPEEPSMT